MKTDNLDWNRVTELFHAAHELPPAARSAWLMKQTGSEFVIRDEVQSLLAAERKHEKLSAEAAAATHTPAVQQDLTEQFGPYQTERLLGQGGMGAVYLARRIDGQFDQTVALKVVSAHLAGEEFLKKFYTERQVLASLNHANITRLLDGGVSAAGNPYLVMEYVDGQPLDRYCDERKVGIDARLSLFLDVCEAVDYAHRNLILHRDLKPGNIFVTASGEVKLLDFGTASLMADDTTVTVTHARMLTPRYASPERLRGDRSTVGGDVFSLGVVLYELLTGAWPFGNPGSVVGELQRVTGKAEPIRPTSAVTPQAAEYRSLSPEKLRRMLVGDLSAIVLKALEYDPLRRYGSVRQLADDIGNFLSGQPVRARTQTTLYRASKFLRRHWLTASAAAVFVIALTVASLITFREANAARAEALKSDQVNQFLNDMLSSISRFDFDPQKYTVVQMLDAADQRLEKGFKGDPLTEAILRRSIASSYYALQRYDKATFHLERAITTFRALGEARELAAALRIKAQVAVGQGQYSTAIQVLEEELEHLRQLGREALPVMVFRAESDLAKVLSFDLARDMDRARSLYQDAIALATRDQTIPRQELADAMTGWGGILRGEGKDQEAETVFLKALETGRKEDPGGLWEFNPLYELSVIRGHRHDYAGAKAFARQMIDVCARKLGTDHAATAQATLTWAPYAAETGELDAAVAGVRQAMPIVEKSFPAPSLALWHCARDAAHVLRLAGRFVEAEQFARESLAVAQAAQLTAADPRIANSWDELGQALFGRQQFEEAVRAFEQAEGLYTRAGGIWLQSAATVRQRIAGARHPAAARSRR
jgi:serine/threonine protein kinase